MHYLITLLLCLICASAFQVRRTPILQASVAEADAIGSADEEQEWNNGCSIYCGLAIDSITSSGYLTSQAGNSYSPNNMHDFNLQTAWIENAPGYGAGQWVEYQIGGDYTEGLAINEILLFNGYRKSLKHWQENSRVKKLLVHLNAKELAVLELADTYKLQKVTIDPVYLKGTGSTFRFTILEVYPGTKYKDTAISEIEFEGIGHH